MQYASDTGAGHNFQGGPITLDDANIGIKKVGADPVYMCDANDYFYFSRSTNQFIFTIGGANKASIDSGGVMSVTELALDGQFYHVTASGNPTINFDSGGDALIYNRSANTYQFAIGGSSACNITATGLTANGLSAPTISVDTNFYLGVVSSQPRILWDASDSLQYDRAANALTTYIGGSTKIVVDTNGLTAAGYVACGTYVQIGDVNFFAQLVSGNPQITFDSGDNITFERTLNKFLFLVGGVVVASIDASGNMRLKGTLTQSVTP